MLAQSSPWWTASLFASIELCRTQIIHFLGWILDARSACSSIIGCISGCISFELHKYIFRYTQHMVVLWKTYTNMISATEAISLLLVGALWGCTNPFMRQGSIESKNTSTNMAQEEGEKSLLSSLFRLAKIKVWLPYLINQLGSLLYYKQLASSNITLSVPICNASAMVFSCITSFFLGERVNQPGRAALGVILVLIGVQICMYSSGEIWVQRSKELLKGRSWNS